MIIVNRNGTLAWLDGIERNTGQAHETIDIPADLAWQQSELFDRVFTFAFDVLGIQKLDLRIRYVEDPYMQRKTRRVSDVDA